MNHNCHNYMDINEICIQKDIVRHQLLLLISAMIFLMQTQHQELLPNCSNFHLSLSVPQVRTLTRDFANFQLSAEQPQLKWGYSKQWKHGNIPTFQQKTVQAEDLKVQASSQRSGPGCHGMAFKKRPQGAKWSPPGWAFPTWATSAEIIYLTASISISLVASSRQVRTKKRFHGHHSPTFLALNIINMHVRTWLEEKKTSCTLQ